MTTMSRTNVEIDDELIESVMRQRGFKTKREAVDAALRALYVKPTTDEEFHALRGIGWEGDLDEMRRMDRSVEEWIEEQDREAERATDDRDA
jgi:Arc/MetJ family transcription regulator